MITKEDIEKLEELLDLNQRRPNLNLFSDREFYAKLREYSDIVIRFIAINKELLDIGKSDISITDAENPTQPTITINIYLAPGKTINHDELRDIILQAIRDQKNEHIRHGAYSTD